MTESEVRASGNETEIAPGARTRAGLKSSQTGEITVRDVVLRVSGEIASELSGQGVGVVNLSGR